VDGAKGKPGEGAMEDARDAAQQEEVLLIDVEEDVENKFDGELDGEGLHLAGLDCVAKLPVMLAAPRPYECVRATCSATRSSFHLTSIRDVRRNQ
jgi:hypothetical protein